MFGVWEISDESGDLFAAYLDVLLAYAVQAACVKPKERFPC
jgi:hypothetical protein